MSNKVAFVNDTNIKLLNITEISVKSEQMLCQLAGKTDIKTGEVRYVSVKDLKRLLKNDETLQDSVSGFVVPIPEISGPVWNDKIAKMCKMTEGDSEFLYELFDDEIETSSVRSWYYENLAKYILKTYMLPLKRFSRSIGKEIIFDLGNIEMQYDLMEKMINPCMLKKSEISLLVHKETGNIEKELGFSENDFVIKDDTIKRCEKREQEPKILLIKPMRGVMERFVLQEIRKKPNRLETPALLSAIESVYYCDMLSEKGYNFDVADEMNLPKVIDLKKYEHILICKACLFTEKETKKIDRLQKFGVKINDKDLICDLTQKGED